MMPVKICRVCGDYAHGFNFNVITCESCKAFFRRNAHKKERLQCSFQGNCLIDIKTRRFCQKCRLDKCLRVGMKQEWILTEQQKELKRAKILENRMKRASNNCYHYTNYESMGNNCDTTAQLVYMELNSPSYDGRLNEQEMYNQTDCDPLITMAKSVATSNIYPNYDVHYNGHNHDQHCNRLFNDLRGSSDNSSNNSQLIGVSKNNQQIEKLRTYKAYQRILQTNFTPIFLSNTLSNDCKSLSDLEKCKINELVESFASIELPVITKTVKEDDDNNDDENLSFLASMTELAVERLINWCKRLSSFRSLCQNDQIALLKGGSMEMLLIKCSQTFSVDTDAWEDRNSRCSFASKILLKRRQNLCQEHTNFIRNFDDKLRKDESINLLLVAIVLFTSDRPNLKHCNTVRLEQSSYEYLLRRYLESREPINVCQATSDYIHLMSILEQLREMNEKITKLYCDMGPELIGPLLLEILDVPRADEASN